jgi:hypothetical protein
MDIKLPNWDGQGLGEFIAEQNIPIDNITFLGEQKDVSKFYDNTSFLILTSRCEGFGMVFLEALTKGIPCASFEYLGIEELIQNNYNGLVRPQDDYVGLAKVIADTIENKKLYFEMSQNALRSVKQFDVKNYYARWEQLIESALGAKSKTGQKALMPDNGLTITDYKKITLEYEKLLKDIAKEYLAKEIDPASVSPKPVSKMNSVSIRFKESIGRDGIYLTGEKIVRKVHKKIVKRQR